MLATRNSELHQEIARLREENEDLRAELAYRNEQRDINFEARVVLLGLPKWTERAVSLFARREFVSYLALEEIGEDRHWGTAHEFPGVVVFHLRQAFRPVGIKIETIRATGYRITKNDQRKLRQLLGLDTG